MNARQIRQVRQGTQVRQASHECKTNKKVRQGTQVRQVVHVRQLHVLQVRPLKQISQFQQQKLNFSYFFRIYYTSTKTLKRLVKSGVLIGHCCSLKNAKILDKKDPKDLSQLYWVSIGHPGKKKLPHFVNVNLLT
jgi:hypothetical protein